MERELEKKLAGYEVKLHFLKGVYEGLELASSEFNHPMQPILGSAIALINKLLDDLKEASSEQPYGDLFDRKEVE